MSSSAAFAFLLRRPWELRSGSSNPQQKPPAATLTYLCLREKVNLCLEPVLTSCWRVPLQQHKATYRKRTAGDCRLSPMRQHHTPTAAASVLEPTEETMSDLMDGWMEELGWGLLPFISYFPLISEWLLAHLTGLWAGGELCNKEPGSQIPHSLPRDALCVLPSGQKDQASKPPPGLSTGTGWSVIKQLFQNRTD